MLKVYEYKMVFEDATDNTCFVEYFGFRLMDEKEVQNKKALVTFENHSITNIDMG